MTPYYANSFVRLYHGDCLDVMETMDKTFDAVLCDLPYGKVACKWDCIIPFNPMWDMIWRHVRVDGAVCLFCFEPFTSRLICSDIDDFRYRWTWRKQQPSNFQLAKVQPLSVTEDIAVFSKARCANGAKSVMRYFPQMKRRSVTELRKGTGKPLSNRLLHKNSMIDTTKVLTHYYPTNIIDIKKPHVRNNVHPTQKPVSIMEYLVKTYTLMGDVVLDFSAGSGTTGVACMNLKRQCVLVEKDEAYCELAAKRLESHQMTLF